MLTFVVDRFRFCKLASANRPSGLSVLSGKECNRGEGGPSFALGTTLEDDEWCPAPGRPIKGDPAGRSPTPPPKGETPGRAGWLTDMSVYGFWASSCSAPTRSRDTNTMHQLTAVERSDYTSH